MLPLALPRKPHSLAVFLRRSIHILDSTPRYNRVPRRICALLCLSSYSPWSTVILQCRLARDFYKNLFGQVPPPAWFQPLRLIDAPSIPTEAPKPLLVELLSTNLSEKCNVLNGLPSFQLILICRKGNSSQ